MLCEDGDDEMSVVLAVVFVLLSLGTTQHHTTRQDISFTLPIHIDPDHYYSSLQREINHSIWLADGASR